MKTPSILILALAAGSLAAQDVSKLDARVQLFTETMFPCSIQFGTSPDVLSAKPGYQNGLGIRFLGEISSAPGFYYEVGGMLDATSYFSFNGAFSDGTTLNLSNLKFTESYLALGAAYLWKNSERWTWGLHLEARGEALRLQGPAQGTSFNGGVAVPVDQETTYLRPWVRGSADYTFAGVGKDVHPFIGIEGNLALLRTAQAQTLTDFTNVDNRNVKAMAPKFSGAFYAGLRF